MGQPGKRVPIRRVKSGESPTQAGPGQAARDERVARDVLIVIELNEVMATDLAIDGESNRRKTEKDPNVSRMTPWPR
jgi:hypothetical protein